MANVEQRERCQLCELEVEGLNIAMFVDEDDAPLACLAVCDECLSAGPKRVKAYLRKRALRS